VLHNKSELLTLCYRNACNARSERYPSYYDTECK